MRETFHDLMKIGKKIQAIQMMKNEFGISLSAAKNATEMIGNQEYGWVNGNPPELKRIYPDLWAVLNAEVLIDINYVKHTCDLTESFSIVAITHVLSIPIGCRGVLVQHTNSDGSQRNYFTVIVKR